MGGKRKLSRARCEGCGLHCELCFCDSMPRISLETQIIIVQHARERHKPTNTAKLILKMFANSSIVYYALRGQDFPEQIFPDSSFSAGVLFPRPDSELLSKSSFPNSTDKRRALVIFDGTWSQCSRMSRRIPILEGMSYFHLPPGRPSYWTVRNTPDPARVCTFEATARALDLLEGHDRIQPAFDSFAQVSARMLFMKGKLAKPIAPDHWHDRWSLPNQDNR